MQLERAQQPLSSIFKPKTCARCGRRFGTLAREYLCPSCKRPLIMPATYSPDLSPREKQIVSLIQQAKSNKEIAVELCLATGTVKEYMWHIFRKLGVTNRTELALWGRDHMPEHRAEAAS